MEGSGATEILFLLLFLLLSGDSCGDIEARVPSAVDGVHEINAAADGQTFKVSDTMTRTITDPRNS